MVETGLRAGILRVGAGHAFATIGAALAAAEPGDTVVVGSGVYTEHLRIERPVTLLGRGRPVIDGGGEGHVVEATAQLTLRGFVIRGSGTSVDHEDSGVMIRDASARVVDNRVEDVLYGIYLKNSRGSLIQGNRVAGKPLPLARRGDAIRLWYSNRVRIIGNEVERARDVVVYFSDSLRVVDNVVRHGRYGLHYMYSNDNVFERNTFSENEVGAFIMYSSRILLRDNVFARARSTSGMGLGLKDADAIRVEGNLFVDNQVAVHLDNSPHSRDERNRFARNLLLFNRTGVRLLPSVRANLFEHNDIVGNGRPVEVAGRGSREQASQNTWRENHWSEYAGFDRKGDGTGDTPFEYARLTDDLLNRYPALQLFARAPALGLVEMLSRFFPLLRPQPVVVDSAPSLASAQLARWRDRPPVSVLGGPETASSGGGAIAILWAGLAGLVLLALRRGTRW